MGMVLVFLWHQNDGFKILFFCKYDYNELSTLLRYLSEVQSF